MFKRIARMSGVRSVIHYIETRYPDATVGNQAPYKYYDCERSDACLKNARRLLEWAENQIQ
jgi:HEPN domain-containing protein